MVLFLPLFFFILPFYTQNFKHSIVCFMMPFIVLAASAVQRTEFKEYSFAHNAILNSSQMNQIYNINYFVKKSCGF